MEAIATPERPSIKVYWNANWRWSFKANRPRSRAVTVEPKSVSPVWITATGEAPPVRSTKMPLPPSALRAKKATAPELLSDGCSESMKTRLAGSVLAVMPLPFPVKISSPLLLRKAASATTPALLITGSPKEEKSGLFVSTISIKLSGLAKVLSFSSAPATLGVTTKTPMLPSAGNPEKVTLPEALIAVFPNPTKFEFAVSATVVRAPPSPMKMACERKPFRVAKKTTVPEALIDGEPRNLAISPWSLVLTMIFVETPSLVKIDRPPVFTLASKPTIPYALMTTSLPKELRSPLALDAMGVSAPPVHL